MIAHLDTWGYALLGGVLPAMIWLTFWLREDDKNPEPRWLIIRTFLFGMLAVVLVLPSERWTHQFAPGLTTKTFFIWALLEEAYKFLAAYFGGLMSKDNNEPLDPLIYMITAALGFAALENTLFIFVPLAGHEPLNSIITGNLRFIGASLLHIISSATIGFAMAANFYRGRKQKRPLVFLGFGAAVLLHTLFNVSVSRGVDWGTMLGFGAAWVGVIALLLVFEKVKTL